ncbi:MAG: alpha/beta fold hydrolase [Desulfopila sp.]
MRLFSQILGDGPPLVILHGLFGMSDNWLTVGRQLAQLGNFTVHIPDLRNHGNSPHSASHRYTEMADDLLEYLDVHHLDTVQMIGHSMGGKLAMVFALLSPERLEKLVVVDIAPVDYRSTENTFHRQLIDTLLAIDLNRFASRGAVHRELERILADKRLADFLSKSIAVQGQTRTMAWKFNLEVLGKFLAHIQLGLEDLALYAPCPVPTLFVKGDNSAYYLPAYDSQRLLFFPDSAVVGIRNAGHWLHSEQPLRFIEATLAFLHQDDTSPRARPTSF